MRPGPRVWWLGAVLWCLTGPSTAWARSPVSDIEHRRRHSSYIQRNSNSSQEWFTQLLDHFNPNDDNEWQQRYWVNVDHYRRGGPVNWRRSGSEDLSEPWEQYAVQFGALMFKLEHRFYGESQPTGGNLTVDDLRYLTSPQALADTADFIVAMNRRYQLPGHTKWVVFGCSQAGVLAAWLRYKYPHLVYAAVASSAPLLLQFTNPGYYQMVDEALVTFYGRIKNNSTMGRLCLKSYNQANEEVKNMMKTPEGLKLITGMFGLNNLLSSDENATSYNTTVENVMSRLIGSSSRVVQNNHYSYKNKTWSIERFCNALLNESLGGIVTRFAYIFKIIYSEDDSQDTPWSYQLCSEIASFPTIKKENFTFGEYYKKEIFVKDCMDKFGERFSEEFIRRRVNETNTMYGGLDIEATRVIYIQGTLDPWFPLGLNRTMNPLSPVILIEGGAHCDDMQPRSDHDSAALLAARARVAHTLQAWLAPAASGSPGHPRVYSVVLLCIVLSLYAILSSDECK